MTNPIRTQGREGRDHPGRMYALLLGALLLPGAAATGQAPFYRAGDLVEGFALTNRDTREPIHLHDFAGQIVFLEWFAWWCPFCQAAAPQVEAGIVRHYAERGGNPDGLPVVHLAVNLQSGQETQTQNFINRAGFDLVAEDFSRALAGRFQSGGQPIFAIINGVADSPSHRQWELLLHQNGYGTTASPIARFRAAIDAVKAAEVAPPRLAIVPQSDPDGIELRVESSSRRLHRLEVSRDLAAWELAIEFTPTADATLILLPRSTAEAGWFYRAAIP